MRGERIVAGKSKGLHTKVCCRCHFSGIAKLSVGFPDMSCLAYTNLWNKIIAAIRSH